jgi:DNA end-binding protein Ku
VFFEKDREICVILLTMRAIWKGTISFGLVNIPVGLYPATRHAKEVKFRLLRDADHSPIRYQRVAEADNKEVPWEHIVKGYEYEKDQFIVLAKEDFERVNVESTQTVDIKEFVDLTEIDPMFFDEPYYLAPEKGGEKGYALLREVLERSGKVGISRVVIKTREHLAAVKPVGTALVVELMHFAAELIKPEELELPKVDAGKKELAMAESLVESMAGTWEPEKYRDEYAQALMELIEGKIAAGGKQLRGAKPAGKQPTNVVDLVAVLQQSLKQTHKTRKGKESARAEGEKKRKKAA